MNRQVHILADDASVARHAAEIVVGRAREAVARHGSFCLLLSGEAMLGTLCAVLVADPALDAGMPWAQTELFFSRGEGTGKRRNGPGEDPSPARAATTLARVPLPAANVHRVPGESLDAEVGARVYAATVAEVFAGLGREGGSPRFDLVILNMGVDARIAGLCPGAEALHEITAPAVAVLPHPAKAPRITLTRRVFNRAAAVLLLAVGGDKADALWRVLEGPADFEHLPAQTIRPDDGEVLWLADESAAARLSRARRPAGRTAGRPRNVGARPASPSRRSPA